MTDDKLDIAKDKFYAFFSGVAGLRFTSRDEFDAVVEAIVRAAQKDEFCTCEHPMPLMDKRDYCGTCRLPFKK